MVHRILDEVIRKHIWEQTEILVLYFMWTPSSRFLSLSLSTHTEYKTLLVSVFGRNKPVQEMFSFWSSFI